MCSPSRGAPGTSFTIEGFDHVLPLSGTPHDEIAVGRQAVSVLAGCERFADHGADYDLAVVEQDARAAMTACRKHGRFRNLTRTCEGTPAIRRKRNHNSPAVSEGHGHQAVPGSQLRLPIGRFIGSRPDVHRENRGRKEKHCFHRSVSGTYASRSARTFSAVSRVIGIRIARLFRSSIARQTAPCADRSPP